jgi:hypothetical protein
VAGVGEEKGRGGVLTVNKGGRRRSEGRRQRSGDPSAGGRRESCQRAPMRSCGADGVLGRG